MVVLNNNNDTMTVININGINTINQETIPKPLVHRKLSSIVNINDTHNLKYRYLKVEIVI